MSRNVSGAPDLLSGVPSAPQPDLFVAFLKSAQFLVRIKEEEEVLDQAGRLIVAHFPVEWVTFAELDEEGMIGFRVCTSPDPAIAQALAAEEIGAVVRDVLETGFLATQALPGDGSTLVAALPVVDGRDARVVMLVGHRAASVILPEHLNVYLGLAGLVGTAIERLRNEAELACHRAHLEELVLERTSELERTQKYTELILSSVSEGLCGLDVEGRITFANTAAAQILGWRPDDLLGRDSHETFHNSHLDGSPYARAECTVQSHIKEGRKGLVSGEYFHRRDGSFFPVEFSTAPITREGETVGAVLIFRDITERLKIESERERLLQKEQALTEELAAMNRELQVQNEELAVQQVALAEQNAQLQAAHNETARLLEQQRLLFVRLQEALLDIPHQIPGVSFGHLYRSATTEAQIGGDFYDVFAAVDGRIGLLIGDVSGHGVEAARIASLVKDTVRAFAHRSMRPDTILQRTNELLIERKVQGFVTTFLGFLDNGTGSLVFSSAGHPPPLVVFAGEVGALRCVGHPLGAFADSHYRHKEARIDPGSILLLYTDGLTEVRRGSEFFGEERVRSLLVEHSAEPVVKLPSLLLREAIAFCGGSVVDDVAVLAVKYDRPTGGLSSL